MAHVSEFGGAAQPAATIAIIGCGNLNRSDDGVGCEIVQALASRAVCNDSRVRLLDAGTDGMAVMFAARGCRTLIIVDACRSGAAPGATFEVPGTQLAQCHQPSLTLHDFRWDHALFAGRRIFGEAFPADVTVLLVEVGTTALGIGLSPCVIDAATRVADRIEALIRLRLHEATATQ